MQDLASLNEGNSAAPRRVETESKLKFSFA